MVTGQGEAAGENFILFILDIKEQPLSCILRLWHHIGAKLLEQVAEQGLDFIAELIRIIVNSAMQVER